MIVPTLFGAPLLIPPSTRDGWSEDLCLLWSKLLGLPPGTIEDDLSALMGNFFGHGVKVRALRNASMALPPFRQFAHLPHETVLEADGAALITVEGRVLLEVLKRLQRSNANLVEHDLQLWAIETARMVRATNHQAWLGKQFNPQLSAAVLGAVLFLLVNRSIGATQGLRLPKDDDASRQIASLVLPSVEAFSEALGGRPTSEDGIREHWAFSQVSRHLTRYVVREPLDGDDATLYIRAGEESDLLKELVKHLGRFSVERRVHAAEAFMSRYTENRGVLTLWSLAHDEPAWTRTVLRSIGSESAR